MNGMPMIRPPGLGLDISRFIFGTASLFNVGRQAKRVALLRAAADAGFTHFDTAPYYGFGWAERDLALLMASHPKITVTTKVGIYSPGGESAPQLAVLLRKAGGRIFAPVSRPTIDFSLARAEVALTGSLRRLRRERVELYMLHEPELAMLKTDEWQRWLEAEVARGRIGAYGLALTEPRLVPFLEHAPNLAPVVQVLDSLDRCEADCLTERDRPLQITYGYVSAARSRGSAMAVSEILQHALARNRTGAIIVSTTKAARLGQYASMTGGAK